MSEMKTSEPLVSINYGSGLTPSEAMLTQLGEHSFLRFWSHANPHINPKQELCDLLVVCGAYVIAFSDKNNVFKPTDDPLVGWTRWYKAAVTKSVNQLNGATRKLLDLRSPIFKDKKCTVPLGLPIPLDENARHYRVAVVSRVKELKAPDAFSPFIGLESRVVGDAHTEKGAHQFIIGDVDPDHQFVHVMDVAGLRAVLTELDTVTDFTRYLDAREAFIRGKERNSADSEWSFLAKYMLSFDDDGEPLTVDRDALGSTSLTSREWDNRQFIRDMASRREANEISRVWDLLIDNHAKMVEEKSFSYSTFDTVGGGERVVRYMALENRLNRRLLGRGWLEGSQKSSPEINIFVRTIPHSAMDGTTYVFLYLSNDDDMSEGDFREWRRVILVKMVLASLVQIPKSRIVIGLASEFGALPESYDHAFLDVVEHDGPDLRRDAQVEWENKRKIFPPALEYQRDEWEIPRFSD